MSAHTRQISAPLPRDPASSALVKALRAALPEHWCVWSSRAGSVGCNRGTAHPDLHITRTEEGWAFDGATWVAEDVVGVRVGVLACVARRTSGNSNATNREGSK